MEPYQLSLSAAAEQIEARQLSPVELTDSVLQRIDSVDGQLGAFACVTADLARLAAKRAEEEIAAGGYRGPLHGLPLGVKDLYDTAGTATTSSSKVRADYVPVADSAVVERLTAAGMVMVGKTHTHEFAYGAVTPTTRNPWDMQRIPGGSSGGSAAAVAAGMCLVGMGSDTGGSIRIPAALCGTVGLKPTYGRVSRRGVASLSWSLDHVGPLTRNVRDAALVLNVIAGYDRLDPACVDVPVPDYAATLKDGVAGLRIGVPSNYYFDNIEPEVEAGVRSAVELLADLGATLQPVTIPFPDVVSAAEWGILIPEASAYHQQMLREKGDLYNDDVRLFLEAGEFVFATDYIKALRVRTLIQRAWAAMFDTIDVLVAPTVTVAAPAVTTQDVVWPDGSTETVTETMVRLSAPANLTGLPALSLPVTRTAVGLPVGMQIIGKPFEEAALLTVGHAYESASGNVGRLAPL